MRTGLFFFSPPTISPRFTWHERCRCCPSPPHATRPLARPLPVAFPRHPTSGHAPPLSGRRGGRLRRRRHGSLALPDAVEHPVLVLLPSAPLLPGAGAAPRVEAELDAPRRRGPSRTGRRGWSCASRWPAGPPLPPPQRSDSPPHAPFGWMSDGEPLRILTAPPWPAGPRPSHAMSVSGLQAARTQVAPPPHDAPSCAAAAGRDAPPLHAAGNPAGGRCCRMPLDGLHQSATE
uniref:Uncharacterized protein n=1 Tax=Setaria viridis TaxID=4556 RepID=A0A4U6W0B0_SETVI|nr:hypothetical protein SEVIR_2G333900v2 [Setaria viridis]